MYDFWEWMKKKEYGECEIIGSVKCLRVFHNPEGSEYRTSIEATKQMLIGYMMEYIIEKEGMIFPVDEKASTGAIYDQYVIDIKKIEQKNLLKRM